MIARVATALCWGALLMLLGGAPGAPAELLTLATVAVASLILAIAVGQVSAGHVADAASALHRTRLRQRARRSTVSRQHDPDAAGHPRPRAPGAALRAA